MNYSSKVNVCYHSKLLSDEDSRVPEEGPMNAVNLFSTGENKLLTDKGKVKPSDLQLFTHGKQFQSHGRGSPKFPYVKSRTLIKVSDKVVEEKLSMERVARVSPEKKMSVSYFRNPLNNLARLDSPDILKSIHQLQMSKESSILKLVECKKRFNVNSIINEDELRGVEESLNSVSAD